MNEMKEGVVLCKLDGEKIQLVCSPKAAFTLSDRFGGIIPILQGLTRADHRTLVSVITIGASIATGERHKYKTDAELEAAIFADCDVLYKPATDYAEMLLNGGRKKSRTEEIEDGKK